MVDLNGEAPHVAVAALIGAALAFIGRLILRAGPKVIKNAKKHVGNAIRAAVQGAGKFFTQLKHKGATFNLGKGWQLDIKLDKQNHRWSESHFYGRLGFSGCRKHVRIAIWKKGKKVKRVSASITRFHTVVSVHNVWPKNVRGNDEVPGESAPV